MKTNEQVFLIAVVACALVFSALALGHARQHFAARAAESVQAGLAGQPRDVDIEKVKRMIQQQYLSDHEAEFYTPVTPTLEPPLPAPSPAQGEN